MTDHRIDAYRRYLRAWAAVPDDERRSLLAAGLADGIVFLNATRCRSGIEEVVAHLTGFQATRPGGSFRLLSMLGFDAYAMATWQFVDAGGEAGFIDHDTLFFDRHRRIERIVMFSAVPAQTLA